MRFEMSNKDADKPAEFPEIDKLIHEPARLMIMSYLYVIDSADFLFLMRQTGLTKGNLSSHMSKLEAGSYVAVEKKFVDKIPRTLFRLTETGRDAFRRYKETMQQMLDNLPE